LIKIPNFNYPHSDNSAEWGTGFEEGLVVIPPGLWGRNYYKIITPEGGKHEKITLFNFFIPVPCRMQSHCGYPVSRKW
jgi:hypothetical protein